MAVTVNQLRVIDAEIVKHVIERGKMFEKREKLVAQLRGNPDLKSYQAELEEWFNSIGVKK